MPGLDGLRALAVIAVVLYHADLEWIPGGFLGVEVFFVISGYLITSLLLAEWCQHGELSLKLFWLRRARRLLPALFLVLLATLTYAVVFLPTEVAGLRRDAVAAAGYVTNWYLLFDNKSYFESMGRPSLLRHLWSLAVEEQFYIFWPLLFIAGMRLLKRRGVAVAVFGGAIASALLMAALYVPDADPSRLYYGTDTRATGLLVGAALAFAWTPGRQWGRSGRSKGLVLDGVGLMALGALVFFFLRLDEFKPFLYQGGFAAVGAVSAVLIAMAVHPAAHIGRYLLGLRPLLWVGLRSYGIYLWHWPVFMVTRPDLDVPLDGLPLLVLRLGITAVLVEVSFRFVEMPVRDGVLGRTWRALSGSDATRSWRLGVRWTVATSAVLAATIPLGISVVSAPTAAPPAYLAMTAFQTAAIAGSPRLVPVDAYQASLPAISVGDASEVVWPVAEVDPGGGPVEQAELAAVPANMALGEDQVSQPSEVAPEEVEPVEETAPPLVRIPGIRVTAIGDSVLLSAVAELQRAVDDLDADAVVGRQASAIKDLLEARREANSLGAVVVIHIGNNGTFNDKQFDAIMEVLTDVQKVVFVNVKVPRRWEGANNELLAVEVQRYPNAVLADWNATSAKRPGLFWDDGIHLRPEGARVYVNLIASLIVSG